MADNMDTAYESIKINDRLARIIAIPLLAFIIPLIFFNASLENGLVAYLPIWFVAIIHTLVYWEGNRFIYFKTRKLYPAVPQTHRRLVMLVLFSLLFTLPGCYFVNSLLDMFLDVMPATSQRLQITLTEKYAASLMPLITCLAIYESVYYFRQMQVALLESEQLKKENIQSQLETLKNQVNPHFLFNSLNTLVAIIPENPDMAVEFVQKLSKVYRYILEIRDRQTVCLQEELSALKAYNFLLEMRFGQNLTIRIDIPDDLLDQPVVPLSLQMLVENAVKHNIISTQKPLTIDILSKNKRIIVQNNLQRKNQYGGAILEESTGLGLQNIQNRYQLLAGQPVDIIVTTQTFTVSLPMLMNERAIAQLND